MLVKSFFSHSLEKAQKLVNSQTCKIIKLTDQVI